MKKIISLFVAAFFVLGLMSTNAMADAAKGQKYYLKYMKSASSINGAKFAIQHTQAEWKVLFEGKAEKFITEYAKKYPGLDSFLKGEKFQKFMPDIKDFCIEFASDSGNVPSC